MNLGRWSACGHLFLSPFHPFRLPTLPTLPAAPTPKEYVQEGKRRRKKAGMNTTLKKTTLLAVSDGPAYMCPCRRKIAFSLCHGNHQECVAPPGALPLLLHACLLLSRPATPACPFPLTTAEKTCAAAS